MTFDEESSTDQLAVAISGGKVLSCLASPFPSARNRTQILVRKATSFRPDSGVEDPDDNVGPVIRVGPEAFLVPQTKELRGASRVELPATVLEDGEDRGVLAYCGGFVGGQSGREAMKNVFVNMEDAGCIGELRGVPVVVGVEN